MPQPICYITRDDRGGCLRAVRLLGPRSDDTWHAPRRPAGDHPDPAEPAKAAAAWLAQRLGPAGGRRKYIEAICLDTDGAVCSWVSTPTADPAILRATIERDAGPPGDDPFAEADLAAPLRFPDLPGEIGYQPLDAGARSAADNGTPSARTPVLGVPDASARLLIDELDRRGIRVGRVLSIWHAMGSAWDPTNPANQTRTGELRADRVVADSEQTTACVLLDGQSGRIIWSWSQRGRLMACGSIRARTVAYAPAHETSTIIEGSATPPALTVGPPELARLTSDWLSWTAQTGITPARVVVIGTPAPDAEGGNTHDAAGIAAALSRSWDDALVDALDEPDTIAATLARFGEISDGPGDDENELTALSRVPGRTHRSMFRWTALALLLGSAALAGLGWQLSKQAAVHRDRIGEISTARVNLLRKIDPALGASPNPLASLRNRVDEARMRMQPAADPDPRRPVLEAFDMLSYVLSAPEIELRQIKVDAMSISLRAVVPDVTTFEALDLALRRIEGPRLSWSEPAPRPMGREGKLDVSWTGTWDQTGRDGS